MSRGMGRYLFPVLFFVVLAAVAVLALQRDPFGAPPEGRTIPGDPSSTRRTALVRAVNEVAPAVVSINTVVTTRTFASRAPVEDFFLRQMLREFPLAENSVPRLGSGLTIDARGYFLTNHHLVGNATEIWITTTDGEEFRGELVGTDPSYDLAVVKVIDDRGHRFIPAPIGDSDELLVGEWAVALGNPYGQLLGDSQPSVTAGVISALHRDIDVDGEAIYKDMIQTDASINPGNSGGPLVNALGEVIGINTFILSQQGVSLGLGFAIPINTALELAGELIRYGRVLGAWVGIAVRGLDQLPRYVLNRLQVTDRRGVVVWTLEQNSPAARAGVRLGDIIRQVNGEPVDGTVRARRAIFGHRAGDTILFLVERKGSELEIPVVLEALPNERFDGGCAVIPRYSRPAMAAVWSDEEKFRTWLEVELAVVEALERYGEAPRGTADAIGAKAEIRVERIEEIEATLKHDVIAFLTSVSEQTGDESRWLHYGMTSSDLLDTALALLTRRAGMMILEGVRHLQAVVLVRAREHRKTPTIGRSHGIHAEPTTFGLKLLGWYTELQRHEERLLAAVATISVGQVSGSVGTFSHLEPRIEEYVCHRLGLAPAPVSTQVIQRDRHAAVLTVLAGLSASLEKFATEVRNLQRTEILEAEEPFTRGQKGSSSMPHKRNPIVSERVAGLARVLRGNAMAALENVALWHERDITHSSVERVIFPDSFILVDYQLHLFTGVVEGLVVYPENMMRNLELTGGLVFSQRLLLELTRAGMRREEAYAVVQENAMAFWEDRARSFRDRIAADERVRAVLDGGEIASCFDLDFNLRHVPEVFARVLDERAAEVSA